MNGRLATSGHRLWSARLDRIGVCFVGRGPGDRSAAAAAAGAPRDLAWTKQVHSARVLGAGTGNCGDGDALTTTRADLTLSVVTADCVPILLGCDGEIASIHAGWRGIVAGIVGETLTHLSSPGDRLTAWLGPAIGPCCYEVGGDVASRVAAASDPAAVVPGPGPKPHLDLHAAVTSQLRRVGVERIHRVTDCTHCSADSLWSYRREGPRAGRNFAFVWMTGSGEARRG